MAGSRLGFERNVVQLHQVLGVRLGSEGQSGMPLRPDWEPQAQAATDPQEATDAQVSADA
jgi:hypothetical protein